MNGARQNGHHLALLGPWHLVLEAHSHRRGHPRSHCKQGSVLDFIDSIGDPPMLHSVFVTGAAIAYAGIGLSRNLSATGALVVTNVEAWRAKH